MKKIFIVFSLYIRGNQLKIKHALLAVLDVVYKYLIDKQTIKTVWELIISYLHFNTFT